MFVTLSELPEYNDKISVFHAMTPPVVLKHNHPLVLRNMETVNTIAVSSKIAFYLIFFVDHAGNGIIAFFPFVMFLNA